MTEDVKEAKPLQAQFDVDDFDSEVVEGIGFEPGVRYPFSLEKAPTGKYMQYGPAKGGLFVLSKKCPSDLSDAYKKHPDQFEIFTAGEINGQQALVPGKDFEKFKPFLSKIIDIAWVYDTGEGKRLVFMSMNASEKVAVNPAHPEWESPIVRLARKLGYIPPDPKSKEKFSFSFLHPGVSITAEVLMVKPKNQDRERPVIDIDTIEVVSSDGKSLEQKQIVDEIDPEIKMTITELAEGCKKPTELIKKVKEHLKKENQLDQIGKYAEAITKMQQSKEILN